jgi:hypothetical protein
MRVFVGDSLSVENRLTAEILSLPSASRAILADKLIESLEFDTDTSIFNPLGVRKQRNVGMKCGMDLCG